jgi:hypothetical protein
MTRSPERAALAAAIERVAEAERAIADVVAAQDRLGFTHELDEPIRAAEMDLLTARQHEGHRLVDLAMGRHVSGMSVAEAETALAALVDEQTQRQRTLKLLRDEERGAHQQLESARYARDKAIAAVVASDAVIAEMLVELQTARSTVDRIESVFYALPAAPAAWRSWRPTMTAPLHTAETDAAVGAWHGALTALGANADAVLPAVS